MIKLGIMGSASDAGTTEKTLSDKAVALGRAVATHEAVLLTGGTTGLVYIAGKAALENGVIHVGISPASNEHEHVHKYNLPLDACTLLVFTGFGLKGRNVVLVRSSDIVLFINGAMGTLNEFTIAHDEGKVIGCLAGTGGVADECDYLVKHFSNATGALVFRHHDPANLIQICTQALLTKRSSLQPTSAE